MAATSYRKSNRTVDIPISTPIPTATNLWHRYAIGQPKMAKAANKPITSTATKSASCVRWPIKTATSSAPGNYFVRGYAVRSARGNARAFNDSVQVRHSGNATAARDMRKQLHIFVVEEDIWVGKSKAKANKKYGDGGATQYYIRDMDKPKLTSTGKLRSFRR